MMKNAVERWPRKVQLSVLTGLFLVDVDNFMSTSTFYLPVSWTCNNDVSAAIQELLVFGLPPNITTKNIQFESTALNLYLTYNTTDTKKIAHPHAQFNAP